jgi:hypothetical protein
VYLDGSDLGKIIEQSPLSVEPGTCDSVDSPCFHELIRSRYDDISKQFRGLFSGSGVDFLKRSLDGTVQATGHIPSKLTALTVPYEEVFEPAHEPALRKRLGLDSGSWSLGGLQISTGNIVFDLSSVDLPVHQSGRAIPISDSAQMNVRVFQRGGHIATLVIKREDSSLTTRLEHPFVLNGGLNGEPYRFAGRSFLDHGADELFSVPPDLPLATQLKALCFDASTDDVPPEVHEAGVRFFRTALDRLTTRDRQLSEKARVGR